MTIITDPRGATFVASQLVPENQTAAQATDAAAGSALASDQRGRADGARRPAGVDRFPVSHTSGHGSATGR